MADFLDVEAVESEDEEEMTRDELDKLKRIKSNKKFDSDDDDDLDEERFKEELEDLIDDAPIEDEEGSGSESDTSRKRKKSDDEEYDDDDYALIEENLGVRVPRKIRKKHKRVRIEEDDEEDKGDAREAIHDQLFPTDLDHDDDDVNEEVVRNDDYNLNEDDYDSDDPDDFIVDEDGRPIADRKKRKKPMFDNAALQEAQDIFGVDFDFEDLEHINDEYSNDEEDEEEDEDDDVDESGEGRRRRTKKQNRKNLNRKSIVDLYEPSELKRAHYTDLDNKIRNEDIPERMQLRDVPVTKVPENSSEIEDESNWIYKQLFCKPTVSTQEVEGGHDPRKVTKKGNTTVGKIRNALYYIRNDNYEIPFIAFYRKEYVLPELNVNDLWKIYKYDGMWCQLKARKEALTELFSNMRQYQLETYSQDLHSELPNDRVLTEEDIAQLQTVETAEELDDMNKHFLLYYSHLIPKMMQFKKKRDWNERRLARQQARLDRANAAAEDGEENENTEEQIDDESEPEPEDEGEVIKPASRASAYAVCRRLKLDEFVKRFGLKPEQFAENFRDDYQRHEVEQERISPYELAEEYCNSLLQTRLDVVKAAKLMAATQLAREPLVRKVLRDAFFKRAKINVKPTSKGYKEIDESHPCYQVKYLKGKPVTELVGYEFLKLHIAESDKLLEITFDDDIDGIKTTSYLEEMKSLYTKDEFSSVVQEWNDLRTECVSTAYTKMLVPSIIRELRIQLLAEAKECVLKMISQKLYNWLKIAPYKVDLDHEDFDATDGIRVMGIAYEVDYTQAPFACFIAPDGECVEYKKFPNLLRRKNSYRDFERISKERDLGELRDFIERKKPHVICVSAESRDALMIAQDIRDVITQLSQDEQFPIIPVEVLDNDFSKIYANSNQGQAEFRDYPLLLRQAISLARRIQDPLVEFSQLCNSDEEIGCLRYHPFQDYVSKEDLMDAITREFVNRTNDVGVDLNAVVQNPYSGNLLQFVCGLGTRKAAALIKLFKQTNQKLINRSQLVTMWHMGRTIFVNCSGFIKINTSSLSDSAEEYVEVLDGSRVHPEAYEWARKMAVDALEYDDDDATNPSQALEEILESPDRLKDLDLDAFADELAKQNFGSKSITLYDIRTELSGLYKDKREDYTHPTPMEIFDMLTHENPETFYIGKLVQATVTGISRRKPNTEQLDGANPVRKDETGLWQCPFCLKGDFPELSEVWNHFDAGGCPGQAIGIRIRLDNGIGGFISLKNLSDRHVTNPEERVKIGQVINCRVINMNVEKFSIDATSRTSDLNDVNSKFRAAKDSFYDFEAEERDRQADEQKRKVKASRAYIKRVITHPSFKNCSYQEATQMMENMDAGECIIRPSSKGADHLTVTWKVTDGIYQHIDILEKNKKNAFDLGSSLFIGKEEFEDLEEIISRYIYPMAACARDLMNYKYYKDTNGGNQEVAEGFLREEQKKNPSKIHYLFSASAKYPGKFMLSFLPRTTCKHEYLSVTPEGYRFRQQMFDSVGNLLKWFKDHFRDPIPGRTPIQNPNTPFNIQHQTPMLAHTPGYGYPYSAYQTPNWPNM